MGELDRAESEKVAKTSEPVVVEWRGGMGDKQKVKVDPYSATVTVNGREFDIGVLESEDLPAWV